MTLPDDVGATVMARLAALAHRSAAPDRLTRLYLTSEHRAAADQVAGWMAEAGMAVGLDAVGNVVGRYPGDHPDAPLFLMGSHIDTVREAGAYDGNLGVVAAIACVDALHRAGRHLPVALEVIAFGDEEGIRFPGTLRGSRAVAGTLPPDALDAVDEAGVSVREALRRFGADPDALDQAARPRDRVLGYLEVHIEQGPVLAAEGLALGVVTSIAAVRRFQIRIGGTAGHAGTVPMALRRDALAAAAELVLAVERRCRRDETLVGTVGRLAVTPGAVNTIPGAVEMSLDLRAGTPALRDRAIADLEAEFQAVAAARGIALDLTEVHRHDGCQCAPWLMDRLDQAIRRAGLSVRRLPSGAGHDAMAIADLTDVAMLFVRCGQGISHNPAETMSTADAEAAVRVTFDFLTALPRSRDA